MITATSKGKDYVTELTDGRGHYVFADVEPDAGGENLYQRPGELLAEAYAACMNITARQLLTGAGYPGVEVVTKVEMDRSDPAKTVFYSRTDIAGDIPADVKAMVLDKITRCPVCKILAGEKEFRALEG